MDPDLWHAVAAAAPQGAEATARRPGAGAAGVLAAAATLLVAYVHNSLAGAIT
jgi:glycerate kinase